MPRWKVGLVGCRHHIDTMGFRSFPSFLLLTPQPLVNAHLIANDECKIVGGLVVSMSRVLCLQCTPPQPNTLRQHITTILVYVRTQSRHLHILMHSMFSLYCCFDLCVCAFSHLLTFCAKISMFVFTVSHFSLTNGLVSGLQPPHGFVTRKIVHIDLGVDFPRRVKQDPMTNQVKKMRTASHC